MRRLKNRKAVEEDDNTQDPGNVCFKQPGAAGGWDRKELCNKVLTTKQQSQKNTAPIHVREVEERNL